MRALKLNHQRCPFHLFVYALILSGREREKKEINVCSGLLFGLGLGFVNLLQVAGVVTDLRRSTTSVNTHTDWNGILSVELELIRIRCKLRVKHFQELRIVLAMCQSLIKTARCVCNIGRVLVRVV